LLRESLGSRAVDSWFPRYGAWPRLFELATAAIVVVMLAAVSAWLLARGSSRVRDSSPAGG
jgi:hypothetical protein